MELASVFDAAPIGLAVLDTELRFLHINPCLAQMNGVPVQDHLGRTVKEVVPDLSDQAVEVLGKVLATGQPLRDVEIRGVTAAKPGVERVWKEQFSPIHDAAGNIVGLSVVAEEVTERMRLEQEVQETQRRLALALDAARIVMWEWHIGSDRVDFTFGQGYPGERGERSRNSLQEVKARIHPQDLPSALADLQEHLDGRKKAWECEVRLKGDDGRYRWSLTRGAITKRNGHGAPLVLTAFHQDITQRKTAEAERKEQAQLLELSFDSIFVWSHERGIERWNRGAEALYGFSAEEARGHSPRALLHTQAPATFEAIRKDLATVGRWRGELTHRAKSGRLIRVQALMQQVEGQPGQILEITRDVTAESEARETLAQRERQLRTYRDRLEVALEAARMGVWEWQPTGDEGYWSPQIYDLLDLPVDPQGTGQAAHFLEMIFPEDRPRVAAEISAAVHSGRDYEVEFRVRTHTGREKWLLSRARVMPDPGGGGPRLIGINLDLSEHKRMEDALRQNDVKRNEFLALLGHELRNPLSPIMNSLYLLKKPALDECKRVKAIDVIARQAEHMTRLVDDLLEITRITQGRIELRPQRVLVAASVYAAVEAAKPLARAKEHSIDIKLHAPNLEVIADPARLTQMISNLVVNAVKYTRPGGHIEVAVSEAEPSDYEVTVTDDGAGISAELMPRLFDMFSQDKRTLDRSEGGLGLGLALVKRLVELHRGTVECESHGPGQGAKFKLRMPREGLAAHQASERASTGEHKKRLRRVLVVDDNKDAADSLATLMRSEGYEVQVAYTGREALATAGREKPEVVFLDLGLPEMDGFEVARRIRSSPNLGWPVLVALSGYAQAEDKAATRKAGFDAHLSKPSNWEELQTVLSADRA